ncbi:alpha/beta fold hydrolase [Vibrio sp. SCSIO 43136]|uniref:alpha/beta fold hydrolase n=1 Tax=Vibrio sp. SCSIO 43136 TaxID=2819101 RepID=UPI002075AE29|nr:alpha/beta fold hydrolase [Vibrio sp. SCSIO 43136]USD64919.1 alpha/beta fold hydrolase [Vibrio sp. SCSIO 43136]
MPSFTRHGQTMHYQDVGQGPVILFGHSYLWDSHMWQPQVAELSKSYRCIVPDLWAHGESQSLPTQTRTLSDYAADLLALMDHLDVEQFSIVGLSVGGMWGAELTSLAPARVKSLVLMDTFVGLEPEVTHAKYFSMLNTIGEKAQVPAPLVEAIVPLFFSDAPAEELKQNFAAYLSALEGQAAKDVAQVGRMVFGRRDQFEALENFALPVLIAVGQQDKPRPVFESYLMNDAITGSELVVVPNAGHIANLENPQFVTDMLTGFLAKVYA